MSRKASESMRGGERGGENSTLETEKERRRRIGGYALEREIERERAKEREGERESTSEAKTKIHS